MADEIECNEGSDCAADWHAYHCPRMHVWMNTSSYFERY